jgi:hypothetical protein
MTKEKRIKGKGERGKAREKEPKSSFGTETKQAIGFAYF